MSDRRPTPRRTEGGPRHTTPAKAPPARRKRRRNRPRETRDPVLQSSPDAGSVRDASAEDAFEAAIRNDPEAAERVETVFRILIRKARELAEGA